MTVGDSEMAHLGYVNIQPILKDVGKETKKHLYDKKYYPKNMRSEIKDKDGKELLNLDMLDLFPLVEEHNESLRVTFDIPNLVSCSIDWIKSKTSKLKVGKKIQSGGYDSQLAGGENSIVVGDHNSQAKGELGAVLVLVERNSDYTIKNYKAEAVDGKKIKPDTWYKLQNGRFVKENANEDQE